MAKWEHWFWVTVFLLFESRCRGQHQNQGLDFIDTLTAPTLTPEEAGVVSSSRGGSGRLFSHPPIEKFQSLTRIRQKNEEKLTIITPSSVVVMSTARPRPTTISTTASVLQASVEAAPASDSETMRPQDVSVSHSFSVVSVKYSSSSDEAAKSESEAAKNIGSLSAENVTYKTDSDREFSASYNSATSPEVPYHTNNSFHHNNSQKSGSISTTISTSSTTVTTTTISSVESTVTSKVYKVNPKTTELPLVVKNVTSKTALKEVKKSSEDPHRAPKSIVHPRNPDNRLLLLDRPFHLSATTTQPVIHTSTLTDTQTTSSVPTSTVTASTTEDEAETDTSTIKTTNFFDGLKYEHNIGHQEQIRKEQKTTLVTTEIRPMSKSETARALDELGFEYNEYMDDSDLLGDDSNDEVIPPFNEENYEHDEIVPSSSSHDSEFQAFSSARAIPSKSGLGSLVYEDALLTKEAAAVESADVAATSRQSKKAPLPHHYEPSTIAGITIGAFLLIFIGTVGLGAFIYHERYVNKPHTLDDGFSDSGGCSTSVDDSIGRVSHIDCSGLDVPTDTYCEEMYNLDNDSFLNSLETVAMPTMLWTVAPNSDSDV